MPKSNSYAGIGSRKTPTEVLDLMRSIAAKLGDEGLTLNTGGATGADTAFAIGAEQSDHPRINCFLPYAGFNNLHPMEQGDIKLILEASTDLSHAAALLAENYHPAWDKCSEEARAFHTRNMFQVLGPNLKTPVDFVICWTPNGLIEGGTGQALRVAMHHGIPIYNLHDFSTKSRIYDNILAELRIS